MGKQNQYVFDHQSLSVKKVTKGKKELFKKFLFYLSLCVVIFAIALVLIFYFLDSPKERKLTRDLEQAKIQYLQLEQQVDHLSFVLKDIQNRDENLYRMFFEAEPPENFSLLGNETYEKFRSNSYSNLIVNTSKKVNDLSKNLYVQSKSFDDVYSMIKTNQERLSCIPAILPVNKKLGKVYSGFGKRLHPIFKVWRDHEGIDFNAPTGTPIYATGDGMVTSSKFNGGYGLCIRINHGFGYETLYAHCSRAAVNPGQKVKRGDLIGYIGSTGWSTGSHLHYEVIVNGKKVDPVYYLFGELTPDEYESILEKAREINQSMS